MKEKNKTQEEINAQLRETYFDMVEGHMSQEQLERAREHLDSLSLEEQNSQLNIITTWMADKKTWGI